MKSKVIEYFLNDGSFEAGKQLYINSPGASLAFKNQLQYQSDNKQNREILHYELSKISGINLNQIGKMKKQANKQDVNNEQNAPDLNKLDYIQKKELIKKLRIETPDKKSETITAALEAYYADARYKKKLFDEFKDHSIEDLKGLCVSRGIATSGESAEEILDDVFKHFKLLRENAKKADSLTAAELVQALEYSELKVVVSTIPLANTTDEREELEALLTSYIESGDLEDSNSKETILLDAIRTVVKYADSEHDLEARRSLIKILEGLFANDKPNEEEQTESSTKTAPEGNE
ncbi:MAG: hypothetical protein EP346_00145 [Bacteroidetes bacterium]|nr:MAG: hypothetical protein EP346_00145 [Bacteroidota bacterium]